MFLKVGIFQTILAKKLNLSFKIIFLLIKFRQIWKSKVTKLTTEDSLPIYDNVFNLTTKKCYQLYRRQLRKVEHPVLSMMSHFQKMYIRFE